VTTRHPANPPPRPRKPYHKPGFRSERVFETTALQCGKTAPTQATCKSLRKTF